MHAVLNFGGIPMGFKVYLVKWVVLYGRFKQLTTEWTIRLKLAFQSCAIVCLSHYVR